MRLKHVKAVVFDWAGTMVDFGCMAPVEALIEVFANEGVAISVAEARRDMGKAKHDHLTAIMANPKVASRWQAHKGSPATDADIERIYRNLVPAMIRAAARASVLIPGAAKTAAELAALGVRIGSGTGYTREMMADILTQAAAQGYAPEVDLTTARDRLVGIILGTIVSAVIFRYVWPEHAVDQLRVKLARVLRTLSQLVCLPGTDLSMEAGKDKAKSLHSDLSRDLDSVLVLSEQANVENVMFGDPKRFPSTLLDHISSHVQALSLIATALLRRTKLEEWGLLDQRARAAETELRNGVGDYLKRIAASVENRQSFPLSNLESALAKWNLTAAGIVDNDRPRLVRRLVSQVESLA